MSAPSLRTVAVLPVKPFAQAKQRLELALPSGSRRALAEAMLTDMLTALGKVPAVDALLVVSADPLARQLAASYGARAIDDPPLRGQDHAVVHGASAARVLGATRVLCLAGDCPLIDPLELESLLGTPRTEAPYVGIVADRHGTGTNGLLLSPPDALRPRYGPDSFARHKALAQEAGVPAEVANLPSLALDVDTPEDLVELRERLTAQHGGAAHTRGLLRRLERSAPER